MGKAYPLSKVKYDYKYIFSENSNIIHDPDCWCKNQMNPSSVYVLSRKNDIYEKRLCKYCRRKMLLHYILGTNCDLVFNECLKDKTITDELLTDLVLNQKACCQPVQNGNAHQIDIECNEDNWRIQFQNNTTDVYLYHQSYIKTLDGERFAKNDFHLQRNHEIPFAQALAMILNYDYEKYHGK